MKRLLQIGLDSLLTSIIPILTWLSLGLLLDKNLINVFAIVYPLLFVGNMIKCVFIDGANISAERGKNKNEVYSAIVIGIIIATIVVTLLVFNVENYLTFMNVEVEIYKIFTSYAIIQMYLSLILKFILVKLYYEEKNTLANRYSIKFNLLNFVLIISMSIISKNYFIIVTTTLIILTIYTMYILFKNLVKFKLQVNLINWIKYNSASLVNSTFFLVIFLFGLRNVFEFGEVYVVALAFIHLITDAQWDVFNAINEVARIDISKGVFDYKSLLKNAYKLFGLLFLSMVIMFAALYSFFNVNIWIALTYLGLELICFLIWPLYIIKTNYLQIEYSAKKVSANKIVTNILRTACSFLRTPFCTIIGQMVSAIYQLITITIMYRVATSTKK